jgi:hypothetical protein
MIKTEVDPGNVLGRQFTELERRNLPFAARQAVNATAFATREEWSRVMPRVFDRPTSLTLRAVLYKKATAQVSSAEIFIRDEAFKGAPPARYLAAQVSGGSRAMKSFEKRLQQAGYLPAGMFAVPGKGAPQDAFGNVPAKVVQQVLSQLGARSDQYQNETDTSRKRRRRRGGSDFFAVKSKRGNLLPGVYRRREMAAGDAARRAIGASSRIDSIFIFVSKVGYRARYDIFGLAERIYGRLFPFHFDRELEKAVNTSKYRGRG